MSSVLNKPSITNKQLFTLLSVNSSNNSNTQTMKNVDMGAFEDNADDDLSKMTVSGSRELDTFFKKVENDKNNPTVIHKPLETPFTKATTPKSNTLSKGHPILSELARLEIPLHIMDSFFCCIAAALSPELLGCTQNEQMRRLGDIKKRLALDLDEKNLFRKFCYVRRFRKGEIQNQLFSNQKLEGIWQYYYFSDYFDVNILQVVENYLMRCGECKVGRPYIIVQKNHGRFSFWSDKNGEAIFTSDMIQEKLANIQDTGVEIEPQPTLKTISHYKKSELDVIAQKLNISTQSLNNKKSKGKLYDEIKDRLVC